MFFYAAVTDFSSSVNKAGVRNCNYYLQEISEVLFAHVLSIVNKI